MRRVFAAVYSEVRGLHQSAYILAIFAILSQALALLRDRLFAHTFGASAELDLYYAAFRIPDILFVLFASALSVYVLIPFVSERMSAEDTAGARVILSNVLSGFLYAYVIAALIVFVCAPAIASALFPGFEGVEHGTLVLLMRIMLIQPLLLGISNLLGVVTQLKERFVLYAMSPLLYNIGIIGGVVFLYPRYGLAGIVWGVVLGALLHALIQLPYISKSGLMPRPLVRVDGALMRRVLETSLPRAFTLSLGQIILLAFAGMATLMATGSVSIFQFAYNLQSVPLAIIGVSYSVAAFPMLARLYSAGDHVAFLDRVSAALRHIVFWTFPMLALIVVLRAQIVRVLLGSGAFDWQDTRLVAAALALFACSLAAQSINLLIVRAFYAGGNTRTPFSAAVIATIATLSVTLLLYVAYVAVPAFQAAMAGFLRVEGVLGAEVLMLPLGFSLIAICHAMYLLFAFARTYGLPLQSLKDVLLRSTLAALGGGCAAYIALNAAVAGIRGETFAGILIQGTIAGVVGIALMIALLRLMHSPELQELWDTLHRRFRGGSIVGSDSVDTLGT